MTENKRLIHGSYGEQRYLHSDEVFRKERNWNINLPSEREFKNGYCIITDKDNTAYSIDELVELLNEFQKENEQLKASLYAEKTNTAEVVNDYSKQFKRHSAQFSFMMDLADDLGVDVATLEALDD